VCLDGLEEEEMSAMDFDGVNGKLLGCLQSLAVTSTKKASQQSKTTDREGVCMYTLVQ